MARYTLSKNFSEIAETYGIFQNASGNTDIEITDDVNSSGIILRPLHSVTINQKVFARKVGSNVGACILQVLPFREFYHTSDSESSNTIEDTVNEDSTFDYYDNFFHNKHRAPPHFGSEPLSVQETPHHYLVSISKDSLKGQNKFLIQFDDKKGR